jgi:hypothetical protein
MSLNSRGRDKNRAFILESPDLFRSESGWVGLLMHRWAGGHVVD